MRKFATLAVAVFAMSSIAIANVSPTQATTDKTTGSSNENVDKKSTKSSKKSTKRYTVKAGDTLDSIAKKFHTNYPRLYAANSSIANPDVIDVGDKIRIPAKKEKIKERALPQQGAVVFSPQQNYQQTSVVSYTVSKPTGSTAGNTYYTGYCTWYAKNRRPDLPNRLGNGGQWTNNAAAQGYSTGRKARAGAIAEVPGHVMYVEKVHGDGTMTISEMNGPAGFGNVGKRRVPTSGTTYIY